MLEKYYNINQAVGVSIHLDADSNMQVNTCRVTVEGDQLSIDKKITGLESLEELKTQFPEKTVVAINLTGKGILQKQTEGLGEVSQVNFSKILPNANITEFYVQNFVSGDQSFVSVMRKTEADKIISQFVATGFIPVQMSLGPFPVHNVIPQLNVYDNGVIFNGHVIELDERQNWITYKYDRVAKSMFPLKVESESLDETLLIPYAAAFNLVMQAKIPSISAQVLPLETALNDHLATKRFKVTGVMILIAFFILLLINFVLFSWLNSSNMQLSEQAGQLAQSTTNTEDTENQIKQKETLLNILGWDEGINKSVLVDQLASLLPEDITLDEIAVNPIDVATSRVQKSIAFFNYVIEVTGTSEKIIPVNEWMARIKTKAWVKNIQLSSYSFNGELNTGRFKIIINY